MLSCMRTTVRLPDALYREAKRAATEAGQTFTAFLEEAVRARLAARASREDGAPYRVSPVPGDGGLQPGVDLDDTASLLDRMEGR
jgi:hypothetical protein